MEKLRWGTQGSKSIKHDIMNWKRCNYVDLSPFSRCSSKLNIVVKMELCSRYQVLGIRLVVHVWEHPSFALQFPIFVLLLFFHSQTFLGFDDLVFICFHVCFSLVIVKTRFLSSNFDLYLRQDKSLDVKDVQSCLNNIYFAEYHLVFNRFSSFNIKVWFMKTELIFMILLNSIFHQRRISIFNSDADRTITIISKYPCFLRSRIFPSNSPMLSYCHITKGKHVIRTSTAIIVLEKRSIE